MDKKITMQALIEEFANNNKIPLNAADEFVHAFFSTIADALVKGDSVKIKGWGTFKVLTVDNRESMNVNTGERIVIKGYNKVSFTPENTLKDVINKPFAQFEAVELNDDYDITQELPENPSESEQEEAVVVESSEQENAEEPAEKALTVEEKVELQAESVPLAVVPDVAREVEGSDNDSSIETKGISEKKEVELSEAASEETEPSEATSESLEAEKEEETTAPLHLTKEELRDNPPEMVSFKKKNKVWRYLIPILLLLLIAAGLYLYTLLYGHPHTTQKFKVKESDKIKVESVEPEEKKDEIPAVELQPAESIQGQEATEPDAEKASEETPAESVPMTAINVDLSRPGAIATQKAGEKKTENKKQAAETVPSIKNEGKPYKLPLTAADAVKPLKDFTAADTTNYTIAGTLTTHELKEGETIIRLAQVYYGDKKLWPYIVKYNWMKDPNHVSKGTVLNIPFLKPKS